MITTCTTCGKCYEAGSEEQANEPTRFCPACKPSAATMKVYVASSWRNTHQPHVVEHLRLWSCEVYDFRNPPHGGGGFAWSDIDPEWQRWTPHQWRDALVHPLARDGFASDLGGMQWADACVLVLPSGRSSHLEAGWFVGRGKPVAVLATEPVEPDLMVGLCDRLLVNYGELRDWVFETSAEVFKAREGVPADVVKTTGGAP